MIIAHRGYSQHAKENTLSAFDKAIKAGATGIECDLRLTKDGKAIVNHNDYILLGEKKIKIIDHSLPELKKIHKPFQQNVLDLDQLFEYVKKKRAQFFLELKSSSPNLVEHVTKKIREHNLWEQINLMGFQSMVKNALLAQNKHPKLKVGQFLKIPPFAYLKKPKKSHTIFMGWLDGIKGSQTIFRTLVSQKRLIKLKKYLEKHGFKVAGGVINNQKGFDLFKQAGITDIVTDKVAEAVKFFKK